MATSRFSIMSHSPTSVDVVPSPTMEPKQDSTTIITSIADTPHTVTTPNPVCTPTSTQQVPSSPATPPTATSHTLISSSSSSTSSSSSSSSTSSTSSSSSSSSTSSTSSSSSSTSASAPSGLPLSADHPVASFLDSLLATTSLLLAPVTQHFLSAYRSFQEKYPQTAHTFLVPVETRLGAAVDKAGEWTGKYVESVDEALVGTAKPWAQSVSQTTQLIQVKKVVEKGVEMVTEGKEHVGKVTRDVMQQPQVKQVQVSAGEFYQALMALLTCVCVYVLDGVEKTVDFYIPPIQKDEQTHSLYVKDNQACLVQRITSILTQLLIRTYHTATLKAALPQPLNTPLTFPNSYTPNKDKAYFALVYVVVITVAIIKVAAEYGHNKYNGPAQQWVHNMSRTVLDTFTKVKTQ